MPAPISPPGTSSRYQPTRRAPAPGKGKQRKIFPEEQGISHLLSLTHSIAGVTSEKLEAKAQHNKTKKREIDAKKKEDGQMKEEKEKRKRENAGRVLGGVRVKSKAEIKAALKTSLREKSKSRKEARKMKKNEKTSNSVPASAAGETTAKPKRKSVSFALP